MTLSREQEAELLDEAEAAFRTTQALLAELETIDLLLKHDRPVPHYTSCPTAAAFGPGVEDGGDLAAQLERGGDAPLSLYVRVSFCRHACWYCSCNRTTTQLESTVVKPNLASLTRELDLLGIGPTTIGMFSALFSQNQHQLKAYNASLEAGRLSVERGLRVTDPDVLERRGLIGELMPHCAVTLKLPALRR